MSELFFTTFGEVKGRCVEGGDDGVDSCDRDKAKPENMPHAMVCLGFCRSDSK